MNIITRLLCKNVVAVFTLTACGSAHAQLTTIASESFNYSSGTLSGKNGGTGWTSAWANDYLSGTSFDVSTSGMTYLGLSASGGSMAWASGGNGISQDVRSLPLMNSGVVYVQFLSQFDSTSGGGTPNIRLQNSGVVTGGFGGNGGIFGTVMSILDTSLLPTSDGSSSSFASLGDLNFVIARIDYQNQNTMMWVNPDLATFDYLNPASPNATYANLAPEFDSISIYSREPGTLDEISVMVVPVPEPSSGALLLMAGTGAAVYARRRRRVQT